MSALEEYHSKKIKQVFCQVRLKDIYFGPSYYRGRERERREGGREREEGGGGGRQTDKQTVGDRES